MLRSERRSSYHDHEQHRGRARHLPLMLLPSSHIAVFCTVRRLPWSVLNVQHCACCSRASVVQRRDRRQLPIGNVRAARTLPRDASFFIPGLLTTRRIALRRQVLLRRGHGTGSMYQAGLARIYCAAANSCRRSNRCNRGVLVDQRKRHTAGYASHCQCPILAGPPDIAVRKFCEKHPSHAQASSQWTRPER